MQADYETALQPPSNPSARARALLQLTYCHHHETAPFTPHERPVDDHRPRVDHREREHTAAPPEYRRIRAARPRQQQKGAKDDDTKIIEAAQSVTT